MNVETVMAELKLQARVIPIAGGDVNQTFRIEEGDKRFFLKIHPGMKKDFFEQEVIGLKKLAPYVRVPETYFLGETGEGAYLLMEWIEPGQGDQRELAASLAGLHRITGNSFGFDQENYLGTLPQLNQWTDDWLEFFFTQRMDVQIELAKKSNRWTERREEQYQKMRSIFSQRWSGLLVTPRLIHGDLWSGNVFFDQQGQPVFVDPAVSYSSREQDIAMSQLFGGFRPEFLATYQDLFPLEKGWQDRMPVYQLYYLMAHLNMFGESYGLQVDQILAKQ